MNMITPEEIANTSPVSAWAQHRFIAKVLLPNNKEVRHAFDLPVDPGSELMLLTAEDIAADYGHLILEGSEEGPLGETIIPEDFTDICKLTSRAINKQMQGVLAEVVAQLKLSTALFLLLYDKDWVGSSLCLDALEKSLNKFSDQTWLYEWPQWIKKVRQYIFENMSDEDKQILGDSL